jgi:hypothetical protein
LCVSAGRAEVAIDGDKVKLTLGQVLMWLTGSSLLPAIGLPKKIQVFFERDRLLPSVHTCAPYVIFPINNSLITNARKSVQIFLGWILDSPGFGQV